MVSMYALCIEFVELMNPVGPKHVIDMKNPIRMAMPPSRTIGVICCFLLSGLSVKPCFKANRLTIGTETSVPKAAIRKLLAVKAKALMLTPKEPPA